MSEIGESYIGTICAAKTAQGDLVAVGRCVAYCEEPTLTLITPGGGRVHWRADLTSIIVMDEEIAQRLISLTNDGKLPPTKNTHTMAAIACSVLAASGPMGTGQLTKAMREAGWPGSGDDAKDKKNVYAAIYKKPEFKLDDGTWSLNTHEPTNIHTITQSD